jgi:hypothetical protein
MWEKVAAATTEIDFTDYEKQAQKRSCLQKKYIILAS